MGERNERVFSLLNKQNKTKAAMAQALGVSRSAISQWEKNGTEPTYEQCIILSNFLNVSLNYLMTGKEKEWQPVLSDKEERDLDKKVEDLLSAVDSDTGLMLDGQIMDDETREIFTMNLKNALRTTKLAAKAKYTPNKYRK
jgi:transcriptional regulator with XRE-family HTH domain